jgi:CheY-like chemotaxis protein
MGEAEGKNSMRGNILILDNTTVIRSPWKKMLQDRYDTTEAMGGFEAVRKLKTDSFDAVIVNISLKQIKGVEAIRKIREAVRQVPVIVLYNPKDILDLKQAKAYGVDYTFTFPLEINNFLAALAHIIHVVAAGPAGAAAGSIPAQAAAVGRTTPAAPANPSGNGTGAPEDPPDDESEYLDVEQKFYEGLSAISAGKIKDAIMIFHALLKTSRIKKESWRRYLEDSLFQLGQCYGTLKEYKKSNACYLQFITKAPHNTSHKSALLHLGKNYLDMKDYNKAAAYFRQVMNMRPYDAFSTQARKMLKKLESPGK